MLSLIIGQKQKGSRDMFYFDINYTDGSSSPASSISVPFLRKIILNVPTHSH